MKKMLVLAAVLTLCLCGCSAADRAVFPAGEVEMAVLHCLPDKQVEVPQEHVKAIADWAQGFEYDRAINTDPLEPGTNTFSVTLFYADGTSKTNGIDIVEKEEEFYYVKREKPPVCWDVIWAMQDTEWVELSEGYANMTLEVPAGWDYSYHRGDGDAGMGINFYPRANLKVQCGLWFYPDFAMCGTGVTFEDVVEGGYSATRASEQLQDGTFSVNYILQDLPGSYVLMADMPAELWPQYEPQLLAILGNAVLAEGILTKEEAIGIAQTECTVEYDTIDARFSYGDGVWSVNFYTQNTVGGDQTVYVDNARNIVNIVYGE